MLNLERPSRTSSDKSVQHKTNYRIPTEIILHIPHNKTCILREIMWPIIRYIASVPSDHSCWCQDWRTHKFPQILQLSLFSDINQLHNKWMHNKLQHSIDMDHTDYEVANRYCGCRTFPTQTIITGTIPILDITNLCPSHDDVIKWKHFPHHWPFVRGRHRSPVNSPHKGQWRGALMFSLTYAWIKGWANNRGAGDLRRYRPHYDVIAINQVEKSTSHKELSHFV